MGSAVEMVRVDTTLAQVQRTDVRRLCVVVDGVDSHLLRKVLQGSRRYPLRAKQIWSPANFLVVGKEYLPSGSRPRQSPGPYTYGTLYAPQSYPGGLVCMALGMALEQMVLDYRNPLPHFPWHADSLDARQAAVRAGFAQYERLNEEMRRFFHRRLADFNLTEALRCVRVLKSEIDARYPSAHTGPQICLLRTANSEHPLDFYCLQGCAVIEGADPDAVAEVLTRSRTLARTLEDMTFLTEFVAVGDPREESPLCGVIQADHVSVSGFLAIALKMRWIQSEVSLFRRLQETPHLWPRLRQQNRLETFPQDVRRTLERHRRDCHELFRSEPNLQFV